MTDSGKRLNAAFNILWAAYGSYLSVRDLGLSEGLLVRLILETKPKTGGKLTVRTAPCREANMFLNLGFGEAAVGLVRLAKA
jgi:hypothetical protein